MKQKAHIYKYVQ